jgi:hypothetical protein
MLIPDIGIDRLFNPTNGCGLSSAEKVEFYIQNQGTDTLYAFDSIFITYQLNGGSLVYDTLFVDRMVVPGDSILFSSIGTVDMEAIGSYQFLVDLSYPIDLVPGNNHLDQSVEVFAAPTVSLGSDQVVNTKTHTLDAGSGFISYLWQDGSTGQLFVVEFENQTPDSIYSVLVTDINGCNASEEVKISFDLWDVGVSFISSPTSACFLSMQEELWLFVKNSGTHAIVDEQINVVHSVDGSPPVTGQYTISDILNPGDSLELLLGSDFDFSSEGDHTVSAYTIYAKDNDPLNDQLDVIITNMGSQPDLGGVNDSLRTSLPVTLDAGAGYLSYQWNGVPGTQTYEASAYGWYFVEVVSSGGCTGNDSIYLRWVTGIEDRFLPGILNVYPVPADQFLTVEYSYSKVETLYLDLFDSLGRKILIKQFANVMEIRETIDVNDLAKGMYYLRLRSGERQLQRQIVIH